MTFIRYYNQKEVSPKKKHLKSKGISITESLTSFRMKKLEEAQEKVSFNHAWTIDDNILHKNQNDKPVFFFFQQLVNEDILLIQMFFIYFYLFCIYF